MRHRETGYPPDLPRILIAQHAAERFTKEIRAHPRVEVGGKYIGFIRGAIRYSTVTDRILALGGLIFEIADYLDDGPLAQRTPGFHRGDAVWQTAEFRKIEEHFPDIEQLGSWHSHHPNGLGELSSGDVQGYMETVNDPGHNHDYFFASLGVDLRGFESARHFLFIRGHDTYYNIPARIIEFPKRIPMDRPAAPSDTTTPASTAPPAQTAPQSHAEGQQIPAQREPSTSPGGDLHPATGAPGHGSGLRDQAPVDSGHQPGGRMWVRGWSETPNGRARLAYERDLACESRFAGLRLIIHDGRLIAKGSVSTGEGQVYVSLVYASVPGDDNGLLKLKTSSEPEIEVTVPGNFARGLDDVPLAVAEFVRFIREIRKQGRPGRSFIERLMNRA